VSKYKNTRNRMRLLAVIEILDDYCFKRLPISLEKIVEILDKDYGILTERKAVMRDIKVIRDMTDYSVDYDKNSKGYIVANKTTLNMEDMEIIKKALIAGKFISKEDTKKILEKIKKGSSRGTKIENSLKFENEELNEIINLINDAMSKNRKIKFDYIKINNELKEFMEKENCIVSPYYLVWYEDLYYLLGNYKENIISHYRVDRIKNIEILQDERLQIPNVTDGFKGFNSFEYLRKVVGMSSGEDRRVQLRVKQEYIGKVRDKFGDRIWRSKSRNEAKDIVINVDIIYNKEFISWILSFGNGIEVLWPESIRKEIIAKVEKLANLYGINSKK